MRELQAKEKNYKECSRVREKILISESSLTLSDACYQIIGLSGQEGGVGTC